MNQAGRWSPDQLKEYVDQRVEEIERQISDLKEISSRDGGLMTRSEYLVGHEDLRRRLDALSAQVAALTGASGGRAVTWQLLVAGLSAILALTASLVAFHNYLTR